MDTKNIIKNNIKFVKAEETDKEIWCSLKRKVWEQTYLNIYPDEIIFNFDYKFHESKFMDTYNSDDQNLYLIEYLGQKIGYFCFGKSKHKNINIKYALNSLYVLKEFTHKGIGTLIFEFVKASLKQQGITEFYNGCNYHNKSAISFYEKMGGMIFKTDLNHSNKQEDQIYFLYKI